MKKRISGMIAQLFGSVKPPQTLDELLNANLAAGRLVWEW